VTLTPKRISQLGRVVTGKTPPTRSRELFGGEYMFVTPSDIEYNHYYCRQTERTVSEQAKAALPNQFIPADAVMFTCIGATIGKCAIAAAECLTNQQINSIVANEEADPKFLYYLLCRHVDVVKGLGGGAATPIVSKSKFEDIEFFVPSLRQQQKASAILAAYDDLIENNQQRIALLEETARILYREWFVHFRVPGHEHAKIIDGIPEGWERRMLGNVVEVVKNTVKPSEFADDDIYIGLEHIPRRSFTLAVWEPAGDLASGKIRFETGDILFCKIRPYFHKAGFALRRGLASSDAFVWRVLDEDDWPLVVCATASDYFVAVASKTVREGSKMPRADWNVLRKYLIPKPPEGLLGVFNDTLRPITAQCKNLALQNRSLAQARDLLLPRLMNGEIAV
jgi:type I restriction enzyme, S subunit